MERRSRLVLVGVGIVIVAFLYHAGRGTPAGQTPPDATAAPPR